MDFGLIFFASTEETLDPKHRYRLVIEAAKYADTHGFSSIWVPERHFTRFGSLYPNPAVLQASLAAVTRHLRLQAGSVVAPLHNPIRVAEEWSMVDNLSAGRVGISFAPGWNPDDFAFFPERYETRKQTMFAQVETIRKLWRGEPIPVRTGDGRDQTVQIFPPPIQPELPVWITAASNPQTFIQAGELGFHLLTHTLDQNTAELAEKIALYRAARARCGFDPSKGKVTALLHTFVGPDMDKVLQMVRKPYCDYLKDNVSLLQHFALSRGQQLDVSQLSAQDLDDFAGFVFDRFATERGLIGTPESCLPLVAALRESGVDELACLLDFGPETDVVLAHLPYLDALRKLATNRPSGGRAVEEAGHFDSIAAIQRRCREQVGADVFYHQWLPQNLSLGAAFRGISAIWRGEGEALALVTLPEALAADAEHFGLVHPALLDACLQALAALLGDPQTSGAAKSFLPLGLQDLVIFEPKLPTRLYSHLEMLPPSGGNHRASVTLRDETGKVMLRIGSFMVREMAQKPLDLAAHTYTFQWRDVGPASGSERPRRGQQVPWLVFTDHSAEMDAIVNRLRGGGNLVTVVEIGPEFRENQASSHIQCPVGEVAGYQALLGDRPWHLLYGRGTASQWVDNGGIALFKDAWAVLAALRQSGAVQDTCIWFLTKGAQAITGSESQLCPTVASLWGLGRTAAVEGPEYWGGMIDTDPDAVPEATALAVLGQLAVRERGMQIGIRNGRVYEMEMAVAPPETPAQVRVHPDATYLISGGLGGLGLQAAGWLVQQGARSLALLGRKAPSVTALTAIKKWESEGCSVQTHPVDVADAAQVEAFFKEMQASMKPLRGLLHLAGILDDGMIGKQSFDGMEAVLSPKILGMKYLLEQASGLELDFFVGFSSISSLMPMPGQSAYAAANAVMDQLAFAGRRQGIPAMTVNWGPWHEVGHAATAYGRKTHQNLAQMGILAINPSDGFRTLGRYLGGNSIQIGVVHVQKGQLSALSSLTTGISIRAVLETSNQNDAPSALLTTWRDLPAQQWKQALNDYLRGTIGAILGIAPQAIHVEEALQHYGLDSLMAIELRNKIQKDLSLNISLVRFMQVSTLQQLETEISQLCASFLAVDKQVAPLDHRDQDALSDMVDQLSEAEIDRMLQGLIHGAN